MPGDLLGFALSGLLIALCLGAAYLVVKKGGAGAFGSGAGVGFAGSSGASSGAMRSEVARKIVHIGVSNWFFIYYYCFETFVWPVVGLGLFAVINFVLTASGAYEAILGKAGAKKRSWGVVYYPLAVIALLVLLELGVGSKVDVGCGLLGMGYGDGFAALIGAKYGKKKLYKGAKKTVLGSVSMLLIVAVLVLGLKCLYLGLGLSLTLVLLSLLAGFVAAVFEAVTPFGLDNISVPIVVFLMAGLI